MAILNQFRERFRTTGAVVPSSPMLARAITRPWRRTPGPRRLLEVGPGGGEITQEILKHLRPSDELTLVEINTDFVEELHQRFQSDPEWNPFYSQTTIVHSPIQNIGELAPFDFIVSTLPLHQMQPVLIDQIFTTFERLLKPMGILSYFELQWLAAVRSLWGSPTANLQSEFSSLLLQKKVRRFQIEEERVYLNIPPAVIRHLAL